MGIRPEVLPFLFATLLFGILLVFILRLFRVRISKGSMVSAILVVVFGLYFAWFFRDPDRVPPNDPDAVVAAADGRIARITDVAKDDFLQLCRKSGLTEDQVAGLGGLTKTDSVRVSIFLSLFDVHVNRAPISGSSEFLGYFPGKRFFTFQEKSSTENQHNAIFMANDRTCCLINQIVGPVARRVVYWPPQKCDLRIGDRIGMMKFSSRLDMYFPKDTIALSVQEGDMVAAGVSIIARMHSGAKEGNP